MYEKTCADHDGETLSLVSTKVRLRRLLPPLRRADEKRAEQRICQRCAQCDKCVCSWCLLDGAHIGETCENLPLYVENRQGKLRDRMAALEGVTAQMDAYGEALAEQPGQLAGWAETQREQIAAHFAQLRAAMDQREEMLTQRVAEVERQLKEDSRDRSTALERTLLSVRELSLTCGQVLDHPNPCKRPSYATSTLPERPPFPERL